MQEARDILPQANDTTGAASGSRKSCGARLEFGASLAAIKAERHRLFLNLEFRLPALRVPTLSGGEYGCPLTANGE
jgi:hypothetical protein